MGDRLSDYDFELPPERIAAEAAQPRDSAKLFVVPKTGPFRHKVFRELPTLLKRGDLLVLNETKVFPARLEGKRPTGGKVEILLLEPLEGRTWKALGKGLRPGESVHLPEDAVARPTMRAEDGAWNIDFSVDDLGAYLQRHGSTPLPPYILKRRGAGARQDDLERYQTVYARSTGSVAAPTAGLHFTPAVLAGLEAAGVRVAYLTLHVGWGTFRPVESEDLAQHRMLPERYEVPEATAEAVLSTRAAGGRVAGVGTTVTRTLETVAAGGWKDLRGASALFIRPGHAFQALDLLVTNFHIPRSTPLLLAAAFAGRERILEAYAEAVASGYRFYSYGDAMFLERA